MWRGAVLATHDFVSAKDLEYFDNVVQNTYLPKVRVVVAVDDDDMPVGFMGMTGSNIDTLFVDPDHHGRGVGRSLITDARRRFPAGLTVDVNEQNTRALGFYEHLGFRRIRRSPVDGSGKPYPLLTLSWSERSSED